ncbi:hypothetical protein Tco_0323769 [Tanacetum coccineum]
MDWLSKNKAVIVCHEKLVEVPIEEGGILRVHRERTLGAAKALMNAKVDEPRISDIPVACDITDVFLEDLLGLPLQRLVEFHIDLVPGETPSKEEHEVHLKLVLELLRKEKLYVKFSSKEWNSGDDQIRLRWMIYLVVMADAAESVKDAIGFEYIRCAPFEALYGKKGRLLVLWAKTGGSSLIGPEHKPLEFEVGDHVLLKVTPWKGVVHFGKEGKLAQRYVGPFEILERIDLVAYRLRLPEELNSVHDTFHVLNPEKCLTDASLHVPLDEIKVDKTLCFVKEPVEIMDREIRKLKRRKIVLVIVRWNSKRGP